MAAYVTDLQIIEREDGPWFQFSWGGGKADWDAALEELKRRIPPEPREWDPEDRVGAWPRRSGASWARSSTTSPPPWTRYAASCGCSGKPKRGRR